MNATAEQPQAQQKIKRRYKLLGSRHYQKELRTLSDGKQHLVEVEYVASDPTRNVIVTDIDLAAKFNQPGSEKFRLLPDEGQELERFSDDAFLQECVKRGVMTLEEAVAKMGGQGQPNPAPAGSAPPADPPAPAKPKAPPHPALANIAKMPVTGLRKLAEDEEIDLSNCKNDDQLRVTVKAALEAKSR